MRAPLLLAFAALALVGAAPVATPLGLDGFVPDEILPPPPADSSPAHHAEIAELAALERSRTAADLEAARADDRTKNASIFANAIGPGFMLDRLPETARLMALVRASEKAAANRAKDEFKRPRPWIVNPGIGACSRDDEPLSSYPSGHATMAFAMGSVLARLFPARAAPIMARAQLYAEHRLVCEMHYRSDVGAGETLGTVVAERLMTDPEFRAQFARAQTELAARAIR